MDDSLVYILGVSFIASVIYFILSSIHISDLEDRVKKLEKEIKNGK